MPRLDRVTRTFWRVKGRPVDLNGSEQWLAAPMHDGQTIGDSWLQAAAAAHGGAVREQEKGAGLLADMSQLDGPDFTAANLRPEVRDFYEHTSDWRMEVWTQWNALFQPGGELISRYFGRRVQQLALPTRPLDVALGMDSRVAKIVDADGEQRAAGWIRTLRSTGEYVYSGCYSTRVLPGAEQPSVHVAFPLEAGNVQVFLRPRVLVDGAWSSVHPPVPSARTVPTSSSRMLVAPTPPERPSTRRSGCSSTQKGCFEQTTCCACGPPRWCACTTDWLRLAQKRQPCEGALRCDKLLTRRSRSDGPRHPGPARPGREPPGLRTRRAWGLPRGRPH